MSKNLTTEYTKELERALRVTLANTIRGVTTEGWFMMDDKMRDFINKRIATFQRFAHSEWETLGSMRPMTEKGIRPYNIAVTLKKESGATENRNFSSHLHEFTNRTKEMKNRTGYVIFWDGAIIGGENVLEYYKETVKHSKSFYDEDYGTENDRLTVKGYKSVPREKVLREKIPAQMRRRSRFLDGYHSWQSDLSIAIFSNSEHAFFVDNPAPKKYFASEKPSASEKRRPSHQKHLLRRRRRRRRPDTQGTGWFRLYAQKIAQLWVTMVIDYINYYVTYKLPEEIAGGFALLDNNEAGTNIARLRGAANTWKKIKGESKFIGEDARLIQTKDKIERSFSRGGFEAIATQIDEPKKSGGKYKQRTHAVIRFGDRGYDVPIILSKTVTLGTRKR